MRWVVSVAALFLTVGCGRKELNGSPEVQAPRAEEPTAVQLTLTIRGSLPPSVFAPTVLTWNGGTSATLQTGTEPRDAKGLSEKMPGIDWPPFEVRMLEMTEEQALEVRRLFAATDKDAWRGYFADAGVFDGSSFNADVQLAGRRYEFGGSNCCPPTFESVVGALSESLAVPNFPLPKGWRDGDMAWWKSDPIHGDGIASEAVFVDLDDPPWQDGGLRPFTDSDW